MAAAGFWRRGALLVLALACAAAVAAAGPSLSPRRPGRVLYSWAEREISLLPSDEFRLVTLALDATCEALERAFPGCALLSDGARVSARKALFPHLLAHSLGAVQLRLACASGCEYALERGSAEEPVVGGRWRPAMEKLTPELVEASKRYLEKRRTQERDYPLDARDVLADGVDQALEWAATFAESHFGQVHPFNTYEGSGQTGIFHLNSGEPLQRTGERRASEAPVTVGLVADWGSGMYESALVADLMMAGFNPNWTLHLGDVYLMGTEEEVRANCLGQPPPNVRNGVTFPLGSLGGFAMNGNHETLSRGYGLFDVFMPALGVRDPATGKPAGQRATYFALENDYWRVVALDTGYNTYSAKHVESDNNTQPQPVIDWLRDVVDIGNATDTRGILLISHHQYRSAFDNPYLATPEQIASVLPPGRQLLWLYGHEHRLAFYDLGNAGGLSLNAYCRCVGVGGYPVGVSDVPKNPRAAGLVAYDDRLYETVTGLFSYRTGFNGFSRLTFEGPTLTVTYHSLELDASGHLSNSTASLLVSEQFTVDPATGNVQQTAFTVVNPNITIVSHL